MTTPNLLLLDTHVWLWFALGNADRLGVGTRQKIEDAAYQGKLAVSAITPWEIGMLEVKGRITLGAPCEKWVANELRLSAISPFVLPDSSESGYFFHRTLTFGQNPGLW